MDRPGLQSASVNPPNQAGADVAEHESKCVFNHLSNIQEATTPKRMQAATKKNKIASGSTRNDRPRSTGPGSLKETIERVAFLGFVAFFVVVFRFIVIWFKFSLFVDSPLTRCETVHACLLPVAMAQS